MVVQKLTRNQRRNRRKALAKRKWNPPRSKKSIQEESQEIFIEDCYRRSDDYKKARKLYKREDNIRLVPYNKLRIRNR